MAGARVFRVEFRIAVARRILNGESVSALSNELKIKRAVLYRWRDAYRKHGEAGLNRPKGRPPGGTTRAISRARAGTVAGPFRGRNFP
jgi:transposase